MPVEAFETQPPGSAAATCLTTSNNNARLILDDGYSVAHQRRDPRGRPALLHQGQVVRNGDLVTFPAGGMLLSFALQQLAPAAADAAHRRERRRASSRPSPRPTSARPPHPAVGGDITVAAFNVLNYFTTLIERQPQRPRRARPPPQFAIQKSKIVGGHQRPRRRHRRAAGDRELSQARRGARRGAGRPGRGPQRCGRLAGLGLRPHARQPCTTRPSPTSSPTRSSTSAAS